MKGATCTLVLVLAGFGVAQQQRQTTATLPPDGATSIFPPAEVQRQGIPTDRPTQPSDDLTPPEVRQLIHDSLSSEPALAGSAVQVEGDDHAVVLNGVVGSETQRELAVRIAKFYSSNRKVVDKINIRQ
jgi:osmotically-inducible protein OsmY